MDVQRAMAMPMISSASTAICVADILISTILQLMAAASSKALISIPARTNKEGFPIIGRVLSLGFTAGAIDTSDFRADEGCLSPSGRCDGR